jgi:hypothetical protein
MIQEKNITGQPEVGEYQEDTSLISSTRELEPATREARLCPWDREITHVLYFT